MNYDKIVKQIKEAAHVWQTQLHLEYVYKENNVRLAFKDIGAFCEMLAINYNEGYVGSGSGGMGLDLTNPITKKAVEVKSCCTIQGAVCKNEKCKSKFNNLFLKKCPLCNSEDYKSVDDSRFGISAKEILTQYKLGFFDNFTMCCISFVSQDIKSCKLTFKMRWYKIDFKDKDIVAEQLKYFQNQLSLGRKDHCNLLPFKYDFYKLCPKQIDEYDITVDYGNIKISPTVIRKKFNEKVRVPEQVILKKSLDQFRSLKTYKNGSADCKDFTIHIPYKTKNLGKKRGDTRKTAYMRVIQN